MEKLVATLYVWQLTVADKLRSRREAGQGTLEYVGMIAVAAIVVVGLVTFMKDVDLSSFVTNAIQSIKDAIAGEPKPGG